MNIQKLEKEFIGRGEVKGFQFKQLCETDKYYIYSVVIPYSKTPYYEVFKKEISPLCVDFQNRIYSDKDFVEVYPKSNKFGVSAWTYYNYERAFDKIK